MKEEHNKISSSNQTKLNIKTFGCKLNHYDSLLIQKQLKDLKPLNKNIFILNTCAVTAQAGKDIRKEADKIKQTQPDSLIVVTGCGAQVETELYKKTKSVDLIVGNSDKKNLNNLLKDFTPNQNKRVFKSNIFKSSYIYSDFISPDENRTRAFLKIQDGCNSFCTFCIIPFARGKSKSLPMEFLTQAIQKLEQEDVKEVVLTGVHIGDYSYKGKKLEDLLAYLLKHTTIPRIRLTSLEPIEITDRLLDYYQDERLCPHFHISLQSACSSVLKTMKRKYNSQDVEKAFQRVSKKLPQAFVGMDVIVGFPSESQKDFEETYERLKDQAWTNIHTFPYSPRTGTYSAHRYESLPQKEIVRRAGLLRHLSECRFKSHIKKQLGSQKKVLLFKKDNKQGLSRDYWRVKIPPSSKKGEQRVIIKGLDEKRGWLKGVWA